MKRSSSAGFVPVSLILNVVLGVVLVGVAAFGIWAFINYQDQKNNVDAKISDAVKAAQTQQQKDDQAVFAQQEKLPTRQLVGPDELGAVTVSYPKTWSVYVVNSSANGQYDAYLYPGAVPSTDSRTPYALRVSVVNQSYVQSMASFDSQITGGSLKATPVKLNDTDGTRLDGAFSDTVQGSMVVFKVRDKTLKVFTENTSFQNDFDKTVLPSLKFNK